MIDDKVKHTEQRRKLGRRGNIDFNLLNQLRKVNEIEKQKSFWNAPLIDLSEYNFWNEAIRSILTTLREFGRSRITNLLLYGYTDAGKSTFMENYAEALLLDNDWSDYQLAWIDTPTKANWTDILTSILDYYGISYAAKRKPAYYEKLIGDICEEYDTRLIVIDEFNQIYSKHETERQKDILRGLRNLPKKTLCPIIVVGTPDSLNLLKRDSETNNRFGKVEYPRLKLTKKNHRLTTHICQELDRDIASEIGIKSDIGTKSKKLQTVFKASKGKVGSLIKIYEHVVNLAIAEEKKTITMALINQSIKKLEQDGLLHDKDNPRVRVESDWYKGMVS